MNNETRGNFMKLKLIWIAVFLIAGSMLPFQSRSFAIAPVANDDAYSAIRNMPLVIGSYGGVLANDTDADGDVLSVDVIGSDTISAQDGSVAINVDGSFTYIPALNFSGVDSFEYTVVDSAGAADIGTVLIEVLVVDSDGDGRPDDEDADTVAVVVGDPLVIPDSSFSDMGGGHRTAILAVLSSVEADIAAGRIAQAIRKLENLQERVNGCDGSSTESPDGNDWITNCDDQRLIRGLIEGLLAHLSTLVSP